MKILMVCSGLFRSWDGLQRMAVFIANSMSIRGHSVLLLYCGGKKSSSKGAHAVLAKDIAIIAYGSLYSNCNSDLKLEIWYV